MSKENDPLLGTLVGGRFQLLGIIGRGGFGVVYDARHVELGRSVAVKVLGTGWSGDQNTIERFLQEARLASGMGHPNIVDVYDLGRLPDGRPYLVMPKLEGFDLSRLLSTIGPMRPQRVTELLSGVASALDAMHAKGLVHRDIKPENMILMKLPDGSELVQVLDFGLATFFTPGSPRLTRQGLVNGTPEYLPPEAAYGEMIDARGDTYSLAVVAFELMTGKVPIDGNTPFELLKNKLDLDPPSLSECTKQSFPAALERVLRMGLSRDPRARYPKAGDLLKAMKQAIESDTTGDFRSPAPPVDRHRAVTEPIPWITDEPQEPQLERRELAPEPDTKIGDGENIWQDDEANAESMKESSSPRRIWLALAAVVIVLGAITGIAISSSSSTPASPVVYDTPAILLDGVSESLVKSGSSETGPASPPPALEQPPRESVTPPQVEASSIESPELRTRRARGALDHRAPRTPSDGAPRPESLAKAVTLAPESAPERAPAKTPEQEPEQPQPLVERPEPETERPEPMGSSASELTRQATRALTKGLVARSAELYQRATRVSSGHAPAWRGLGLASERLGRRDAARRAYRRYLELAPGAGDSARIRARLERLGSSSAPSP